MRRDQLEHAIRTACQILPASEVIVVGSQAILGTYDESQLPAAATMSIEVDILPIAETNDETARLSDLIEGVAGQLSPFEELHGFSIDGVDLETAVRPGRLAQPTGQGAERQHRGGRRRAALHRLVSRQGGPLRREAGCFTREGPQFRHRAAQVDLVDADLIASRLRTIPNEHVAARGAALTWLRASRNASGC